MGRPFLRNLHWTTIPENLIKLIKINHKTHRNIEDRSNSHAEAFSSQGHDIPNETERHKPHHSERNPGHEVHDRAEYYVERYLDWELRYCEGSVVRVQAIPAVEMFFFHQFHFLRI